jgi:hypothetical protein
MPVRTLTITSLSLLSLVLLCCGGNPAPAPAAAAAPAPGATADATADATGSAAAAPSPTSPEPTRRQQRPLDLTSACPHDVKLYYGDQPGDGKGTKVSVPSGATLQVPRNPDGAVVIWVTDDSGAGLASVHVTWRMKHVKIDAACGRIDAE